MKKLVKTIYYVFQKIQSWLFWSKVPQSLLVSKSTLYEYGGRLFIEDINNDGVYEFLWLQTSGIYKSKLYKNIIQNYYGNDNKEVFCLTATDQNNNILWQIGTPYTGHIPYLTHADELMLTTFDVNNDGCKEVLVIDNNSQILIINGKNGFVEEKILLPDDNFSIICCTPKNKFSNDFMIIVGVMDRGYKPHSYANPWLFIDSKFNIISERDYIGAGHNIILDDVNKDGQIECLIGYQLVDMDGDELWTVDYWMGEEINDLEQHSDHAESIWIDGEWYVAIAGSDQQYLVNSKGRTLWYKKLPHPQHCLIGQYNDELRVFVLNQREIMNSYLFDGKEVWSGVLPEYWPVGKPDLKNKKRPIHMSDPMILIKTLEKKDYFLYKEGGWPYLCDFNGKVVYKFPLTPMQCQPSQVFLYGRINDIGLSFDAQILEREYTDQTQLVIYNRNNMWLYQIPSKHK